MAADDDTLSLSPDPDETLRLPPTPAADVPHLYVINSNEEFLALIDNVLTDARVRVTLEQLRPNVEVTLANLRSARPDLILLDFIPFRRDAVRLLSALASSEDMPELPVLLVSTNPAHAAGVADQFPQLVRDVLPKPFDLNDLFARLHALAGVVVR
jgi:DNA-binding response OmpR family regulator